MSLRERLYPREQELPVLVRHCADARYVWNLALEQRNLWVRGRTQKITYYSQARELVELRGETWLKEGSAQSNNKLYETRPSISELVEETRSLWETYLAQSQHQRRFCHQRPVR